VTTNLLNSGQEGKDIPKLLAPARSFEGGVRVIEAGADEVYCGVVIPELKDFELYRGATAEISSYDELERLVKYAHGHNAKIVVTVNQPFQADVIKMPIRNHIRSCIDTGIDALIVGDIGILSLVKEIDAEIPLYASTYMVSTNYEAVDFLRRLGFNRVILERQLMIDEISEIVRLSRVEVEIFIHGGGCSNINGSCYMYHRFPQPRRAQVQKKGLLGNPCSLTYEVYDYNDEQKKLGDFPIMDALEYCSLCKLQQLVQIGVKGFKIEGRGSFIWYQESTTRAYRELIDALVNNQTKSFQEKLKSLRSGDLVPFPPLLLNLQDFCCSQERCYYSPLTHAPYRHSLSWQTKTKLLLDRWLVTE